MQQQSIRIFHRIMRIRCGSLPLPSCWSSPRSPLIIQLLHCWLRRARLDFEGPGSTRQTPDRMPAPTHQPQICSMAHRRPPLAIGSGGREWRLAGAVPRGVTLVLQRLRVVVVVLVVRPRGAAAAALLRAPAASTGGHGQQAHRVGDRRARHGRHKARRGCEPWVRLHLRRRRRRWKDGAEGTWRRADENAVQEAVRVSPDKPASGEPTTNAPPSYYRCPQCDPYTAPLSLSSPLPALAASRGPPSTAD
jgi:hypothetical protein